MNIYIIFLTLFLMLILYFSIHMIINRGKFDLKYMAIMVMYSLLVGLPVFYFSLYPEKINLVFYISIYALLLVPTYVREFYHCLKGRQSWLRFILLFIGVNIIIMNPFLEGSLKLLTVIIGLLFVFGFFVYQFRYPHLNPVWLDDAAEKAAKNIEKGKYSSKPVIVSIPSKRTSCAGSSGIFLLFKKKHAIVRIKRDFHKKLDSPNMEQFAEKLVKRIKERICGEK